MLKKLERYKSNYFYKNQKR